MSDKHALCIEIDTTWSSLFQSYEELSRLRDLLHKQTKEGSFKIAKARVAVLPTGRITQDQYGSDISATSVVESEENGVVALKKLPPRIKQKAVQAESKTANMDIYKILSQAIPASTKTELTNTKEGAKVFVKKAQPESATKTPETKEVETQEEDSEETSTPEMKNPLYWFGYFPPQPLVQAQRNYSEGRNEFFTDLVLFSPLSFLSYYF
eukprot:TRINITY_DN4036_c0_g1_i3.p1 TRINITY_DN4036_c0_g1~~TRINITY_DN4036_c0_g1_i3.p1  ORF type:complete len:210 (-),score=43.98 TRINITY_DN4036_c0_g1_i3:43-672(-)